MYKTQDDLYIQSGERLADYALAVHNYFTGKGTLEAKDKALRLVGENIKAIEGAAVQAYIDQQLPYEEVA